MSRDEEAISTLDKELLRLNVLFKENHSMSQRVGYLIRAYTALQIYDKPRELNEFRKPIMPMGLRYEDDAIKRPPQSWCYIG